MNLRLLFLVLFLAPSLGVWAEGLDEVYRHEIEGLRAEKKALFKSKLTAAENFDVVKNGVSTDIESLSKALTRLRADNAVLGEHLPRSERARSVEAQNQQIIQLELQIESWLKSRNLHAQKVPEALDIKIGKALDYIKDTGSLRVQNGEYFSSDDVEVMGPVFNLAQVARWSRNDGLWTALRRLPSGNFRADSHASANETLPGLGVLVGGIVNPLEGSSENAVGSGGTLAWLNKGGSIMWVIAGLGILAALLVIERATALIRAFFSTQVLRRTNKPSADDIPEHFLLLPIRTVLNAGKNDDVRRAEEQATQQLLQARAKLSRGVAFLAVVASAAPLLGLLGTVTGMIATFAVITEHGTGDPRLLSGGISEALLTTQFGLAVAIPVLLCHTALHRGAHALIQKIESYAVNVLLQPGGGPAAGAEGEGDV